MNILLLEHSKQLYIMYIMFNIQLAQVPGVARGIKEKISQFGSAVWPTYKYIYRILFQLMIGLDP